MPGLHRMLQAAASSGAGFVGALDGTPGLVHVYDIARRWLTSYEGDLVRLRRSSDNAELDFTYDANGDLDTAAIATWAGGSSLEVTVYDQVSGDDVTQGTAGSQPLFVASGQNGHAVGRYNGTSHSLSGAYTNGGALSQPHTVYACGAGSADQTLANSAMIDGILSTARAGIGLFGSGSNTPWSIIAGALLSGANGWQDATFYQFSALFNSTSSELWRNGVSLVSGNAGAQNAAGMRIGSRFDGTAIYWQGDIATIIIADPSHDDTERGVVEAALDDYWSIIP
jgi:hypothetical protein